MKKAFIFFAIIVLTHDLFAQNPQNPPLPPIPSRSVSGIVQDSTDEAIIGAIVTLTSQTDTLKTRTNEEGLFFFRDVKAWEFTLSVSSLGYRTYVKLGKYNDATARLTMHPIVLKNNYLILKEVVINGTPSIIYKTDTVEYRASDYIVREGSTVDELLKKMEGMDVGTDGSLTYNGVAVEKARLNGKDFMGGNIASTIQNLPADIVDKIQVVDDYGDEAIRTGRKDGIPSKLLNITTKADRSVGYMAKVRAGGGNDKRYDGSLNGTRIKANQNFTLAGNINNSVNGIAGNVLGGSTNIGSQPGSGTSDLGLFSGSGGMTNSRTAGFTYRDDWSSKSRANINYGYNSSNSNTIINSFSQDFSTQGTTFSTNESTADNNSDSHNFTLEFEADLDSANYLKVTPALSYQSTVTNNQSSAVLSGLIRQDQKGINSNFNRAPKYGLTVFYQHVFPKSGRNVAMQLSGSNRNNQQDREQDANIIFFNKVTDAVLKDSLIHRLIERDNLVKNYRASVTYSEPLSAASTIQFNSQINYNDYDNKAISSNLNINGLSSIVDSLSNIFRYSFTQARLSLNYRYQQFRKNLSLGVSIVPAVLSGTNSSLGTLIHRSSLNIVPILRYQYSWTSTQQFSMYYSGNGTEPLFDQIQPVRDVTNPQNPVVGNPNLKAAFNHTINADYRNYFPNSRFSLNAGLNAAYFDKRVTVNIVQVEDAYNSLRYERHYLNVNGTYQVRGNYTITKQLSDRRYNFTLAGNINHQHDIGMSNNSINISRQWSFVERLGVKMTPSEKLEINPSIAYTYYLGDNSLPSASDSRTKILSLQSDGIFYFLKSWLVGYSGSKNFIHGINSNLAGNPLILNTYLERQFFKRNAGSFRVQAFDIFNQNKFINRNLTGTSITDTNSSRLSRYFMVSFSMKLQQWKGTPTRNGKEMQRRGDGSFIY